MTSSPVRPSSILATATRDGSASKRWRAIGGSIVRDTSADAVAAGLTTFIWYVFGGLTLQLAVLPRLDLTPAQASSWISITWLTSGLASIGFSLVYRQPLPIVWTIPGLVYLGAIADRFSFAELVGANLVAGLLMVLLSLLRFGERLMRWIPLPILMGMFAASILDYITRLVQISTQGSAAALGAAAGYLIGKALGRSRLPPMALAVLCGALVVLLTHGIHPRPLEWGLPQVVMPSMRFTLPALVTVSVPMLVLALGLGNIQGLSFLSAQGYRVPVTSVSLAVGIATVVNALFGGHPASVGRIGVAMAAGPDAGPLRGRYVANLLASVLVLTVALAAITVITLVRMLPSEYIVALAGLGILSAFQGALERAFGGPLRFGAVITFAVALTPFTLLGIPSVLWAVVVGLMASVLTEREVLLEYWRTHGHGVGVSPRGAVGSSR